MDTFVMKGIEKVEVGTASKYGIVNDWVRLENIQPDSVQRTKNNGTLTPFIPEDKDSPLFNTYTAPEPGTITIGVAEQKPTVMQRFFNTIWNAVNSTLTVLAKEKVAALAVRLTSRPVDGRRSILTYYNLDGVAGFSNNIAKTVNEALAITATVKEFLYLGQEAHFTQQWVNEDGSPIDSTPATVNAGSDTTSSAATKALTGTATAANDKTILQTFWSQISGPAGAPLATMTAPTSLTNTVGTLQDGTYVFRLTVVDSSGVETSDDIQVVVTLA